MEICKRNAAQAALHELIQLILQVGGNNIRVMRDPTRGGLASALNELAEKSDVGFIINENKIPINPSVAAACEFLGLDPLYVANEGKLIAVVAPLAAADILKAMRSDTTRSPSRNYWRGHRRFKIFCSNDYANWRTTYY